MSRESLSFERDHFNLRADRWKIALQTCSSTRTLEVHPFRLLIASFLGREPRESTLVDMMAGNGFLSGYLVGGFRRIIGVDASEKMLAGYPGDEKVIADTMDPSSLMERLSPDLVLSLAGMHHVYLEEGGAVVPEATQALQERVLASWIGASSRPLVVMADVTEAPSEIPAGRIGALQDTPLAHGSPTDVSLIVEALQHPGPPPPSLRGENTSLGAYVNAWNEIMARPRIRDSEGVSSWFDRVVCAHGAHGHRAHFMRPRRLVEAMEARGLTLEYIEIPTPWYFRSAAEMCWFLNEKFSFAPPLPLEEMAGSESGGKIEGWARDYLGLLELANGGRLLSWSLGYYVGRARGEQP